MNFEMNIIGKVSYSWGGEKQGGHYLEVRCRIAYHLFSHGGVVSPIQGTGNGRDDRRRTIFLLFRLHFVFGKAGEFPWRKIINCNFFDA